MTGHMNYYKHHIGDYTRDTAHLSMQEDGCYRRMLDLYYKEERPLSLDAEILFRKIRARSNAEKKTTTAMLNEFFTRYEDGWRHGRCDRELISMQNKAVVNRENGIHGGRPRGPPDNPDETQSVATDNPDGSYARAGPLAISHKPLANSHKPLAISQGSSKPSKVKSVTAAPSAAVWAAYETAYKRRYGVEPVRNAKVNSMLAKFAERIPQSEAPGVAAYFVASNRSLYVSAKHCIDLLLRDAESIRTEWATGSSVTDTEAKQADRTQANSNVWGKLIKEATHDK